MGLLVGLPLGLFRMLTGLLMLAVRFALPIAVIVVVILLLRRASRGGRSRGDRPREPEFRGPVYTVDYEEVDEQEDGKKGGT